MAKRTCSVATCERPSRARGWCTKHYSRWKKRGSIDLLPRPTKPVRLCQVDGCDKPVLCRGWCRTHYTRWYESGSLEIGVRKRIYTSTPIDQRFWPKVKKTETCWLWTGKKTRLSYGSIWGGPERPKNLMAHRVSWELNRGPLSDELHIDHLCRVPSCVNPDHLEPVTRSVNAQRGLMGDLGREARKRKQAARTHCRHGHPLNGENKYVTKAGTFMCLKCVHIRNTARRRAKKEGVPYVDPFLSNRSS